ncbi:beta-ketoacyl synthase N-terminal-like domain-containing protein [Streptomyces sp. NPDC008139]|uniref:type I polyketide synthase n=1 Tax=Streptomyces sp. NPDC008139 TaxID=3364814 RepID=UPI0036EEE7CD
MAMETGRIVEALRAALTETERLREENQRLLSAATEPLAVVGMACRFPGGADTPEKLWEALESGRDMMTDIPDDRGWDLGMLLGDGDTPGASIARQGGFLTDLPRFDAEFFGISPREALAMDPQQRLALEVSWAAVENARIDPHSLKGSATGVFLGVSYAGYGTDAEELPPQIMGYQLTGNASSVASGRIAYVMGLEGPAVSIDTACSSSLVALHQASQALRSGDCAMALVGGASVMPTPTLFIEFTHQRGLAADGRIKAFAAAADGFAWAEGAGAIVVERLSDARRNGHRVHAVIRGSAINQDGASNGLAAPSSRAQAKVIRAALRNAGLSAHEVDIVEAHGSGTTLGDPIEASALLATYGQERPADQPLRLGSIKSNFGHTGAAAGIAGVLKMVLAISNGAMPKSLHIDAPTPAVDWDSGAVRLLTETITWPEAKPADESGHQPRPRRGAVSGFGISGTNVHAIFEQAPAELADPAPPTGVRAPSAVGEGTVGERTVGEGAADAVAAPAVPVLLPVSGDGSRALRAQAARLADHLADRPELAVADVGYSLATTRAELTARGTVLAADREEALRGLRALADGVPDPDAAVGPPSASGRPAFLFTGQGAQRAGAGQELYATYPAYAAAFDAACAALDPHLERPLRELAFAAPGSPDAALLDETRYTQPVTFAVQVALYRLLESWGVRPGHLIGHSVGELSAAHLAGVLSLPEAAELVAARGRLMGDLPSGGAMAAIQASEAELAPMLAGRDHEVSLGAVNGPRAVVVSGDEAAVDELVAHWAAQGRKTRRLAISIASHSTRMDPILDAFRDLAATMTFAEPEIPVLSNVTGTIAGPGELTSPDYWARHIRSAVRFLDGMRTMAAAGVTTYVELGPDSALSSMARDSLGEAAAGAVVVPALRRDRPEARTLLAAVAAVQTRGVRPDWEAVFAGTGARVVDLPTYAFQGAGYWLGATGAMHRTAAAPAPSVSPVPAAEPAARQESGTFRERLAGLGPDERPAELLGVVRLQVARVLGHPSGEHVDPDRELSTLGFDSLSAVELSTTLSAVTGIALPSTLVFDHASVDALAAHLDRELGDAVTGSAAPAAPAVRSAEGLSGLFERAVELGRGEEAHDLLARFADYRAQFTTTAELTRPLRTVKLADGPDEPLLICFPTFIWRQNFHQYARFAAGLGGRRATTVVGLPGFVSGEELPFSVDSLTEALAQAAQQAAGGRRFAVLGYSGGGNIAAVTAARLAADGHAPAGLVLIDTPTWGGGHGLGADWTDTLQNSLRERREVVETSADDAGEAWLTARARYAGFDYGLDALTAPTLLVRASEPIGGHQGGAAEGWRVDWALPHDTVDVPGDHFSMIEAEHAAATAAAVDGWLSALDPD